MSLPADSYYANAVLGPWLTLIKPPAEGIVFRNTPNRRVVCPAETASFCCRQGHLRPELVVPLAVELFPINGHRDSGHFCDQISIVDWVSCNVLVFQQWSNHYPQAYCSPSCTTTRLTYPETGAKTETSIFHRESVTVEEYIFSSSNLLAWLR
jgi:hypothetical protein